MIKSPSPAVKSIFQLIQQEPHVRHAAEYLELARPLDSQGRYLHFDQLRHRFPAKLDQSICWGVIKLQRSFLYQEILPVGEPGRWCNFVLTPPAQRVISTVDRHASTAALEYMTSKIGKRAQFNYLLKDLIEDEAISSSQLEGAATTTRVAKDMLKRERKPRTPDEKMIIGNYRMMQFAWDRRSEPLSIALITEMHQVGVGGVDDDKYSPGVFRLNDDVVVQDGDGNVVHTPPPATGIEERLQRLIDWINTCHDDASTSSYVHPLIKGSHCILRWGTNTPLETATGVSHGRFFTGLCLETTMPHSGISL